jgi:VTC domain
VPELPGLDALPTITLPEVLAAAPATVRVDRKYLMATHSGAEFLTRLPDTLRLLSIDGRLTTSYRSTYFDTADLLTCRAHIQGRRRRWKARSRLYVEDRLCRLELKVRDGSGLTRKFFHAPSCVPMAC